MGNLIEQSTTHAREEVKMQDTSSLFTQVVLYVFQIQKEEIMQQASYLQVLSARVSLGSLSSTGASGCIYRRYPRGDTSQGDAYTCIQGSVHQCFCMKWVLSSQNTHWRAGQCRAWCGCTVPWGALPALQVLPQPGTGLIDILCPISKLHEYVSDTAEHFKGLSAPVREQLD